MFAIDDPKRVELFFSGKSVVLRRNLERKEAADYFRKLHDIGLGSELVKVTDEDAPPTPAPESKPKPAPETQTSEAAKTTDRGMDRDILQRRAGHVDQSWAVPSRPGKTSPTEKQRAEEEAALKKAEADARKKAEAEAKQRAAEEAARKKAEEDARKKAEAEAKQRAAEEAARKKAEEDARKKAEAEAKQRAAEEAARKKAEEDARKKA
ncbi:MAG: hypothetical protein ABJK20_10765, partial [Halieaceae bacterium]